jgi:hypothetical protein
VDIRFENGSNRTLNMKLCLEGMYEVIHPNMVNVTFTSQGMSRNMFLIKLIQEHKRGITFLFYYCLKIVFIIYF